MRSSQKDFRPAAVGRLLILNDGPKSRTNEKDEPQATGTSINKQLSEAEAFFHFIYSSIRLYQARSIARVESIIDSTGIA